MNKEEFENMKKLVELKVKEQELNQLINEIKELKHMIAKIENEEE